MYVLKSLTVFAMLAGVGVSGAFAARIDLTPGPGSSGAANGAVFISDISQPTGTGVFQPFVRMQRNATEQGYNTDGRPVQFDEDTSHWTHDLLLSEIPIIDGYYQFMLDLNEPGSVPDSLISLDEIQIYTSPIGAQIESDVSLLGTLRYDLDADEDNHILIDYLWGGSGVADMLAQIPASAFGGASPTDFVYFYSQFGLQAGAESGSETAAGYEEWAVVNPEPTSVALMLTTILCLLLGGRRRRAA